MSTTKFLIFCIPTSFCPTVSLVLDQDHPHRKLFSQQHTAGISYLTGRQQRVVLDGTVSHPAPVTSGVPQGSILGPLLFNIHMNSISSLPLSQNARLILYADDILLFKPVNSAADVAHLQQDVNLILSWMDTHGLTPNHSKTQLLPITRTKRPLSINIYMGSHPIPPCKSVKYLGVTISSNLTWSEHIKSTCKKAKQRLGFIHYHLSQSPPNVCHWIYRATVLPKLEYCCAVWDPHYVLDIDALESVQKFAGRVITRQWHSDYHTLCSTLNWQPLSVRRKLQKLSVLYRKQSLNHSIKQFFTTSYPFPPSSSLSDPLQTICQDISLEFLF